MSGTISTTRKTTATTAPHEQNPHTIYGDEDPDDDIDPSTLTDDDWSRRAFEFGADEIDPDKLPDN